MSDHMSFPILDSAHVWGVSKSLAGVVLRVTEFRFQDWRILRLDSKSQICKCVGIEQGSDRCYISCKFLAAAVL